MARTGSLAAAAVAALLLAAVADAFVVAPCLQGKPATTAAELARDDWVCSLGCTRPVHLWADFCKRCCPKWLGGDGANAFPTEASGDATKATTAATSHEASAGTSEAATSRASSAATTARDASTEASTAEGSSTEAGSSTTAGGE